MFGVILKSSYYQEGDERSRTNPGHGYAGGIVHYTTFESFKDEAEMMRWLERNKNEKFQLIEYEELQVETKVTVKTKIVKRECPIK